MGVLKQLAGGVDLPLNQIGQGLVIELLLILLVIVIVASVDG